MTFIYANKECNEKLLCSYILQTIRYDHDNVYLTSYFLMKYIQVYSIMSLIVTYLQNNNDIQVKIRIKMLIAFIKY